MAIGTETVGFRVKKSTKEALDVAAKKTGQTVTEYLRNVVEGALEGGNQGAKTEELREDLGELRRDVRAAFKALGVYMAQLRMATGGEQVKAAAAEFQTW